MDDFPNLATVVVVSQYAYVSRHWVKPDPKSARAGAFEIFVDGRSIGYVPALETLTQRIGPGKHTIRARLRWYRSAKLGFELAEGESATFVVTIPKTALTALKLLILPLRSIMLADTEVRNEGLTP
jgi:hypothetical protein